MMHEERRAAVCGTTAGYDLGVVDGLGENAAVVADGLAEGGVAGSDKIRDADEDVTRGTKSVATITIPLDAEAGAGFRWQGCPANVIAALTPSDPCRCPLAAGHPYPAMAAEMDPATVVVGGPAKRLIRLPSPTQRGPAPAAIDIRPPSAGASETRLEAETVTTDINPAAMRRETIIKEAIISTIALRGLNRCRWRPCCHKAAAELVALLAGSVRLGS